MLKKWEVRILEAEECTRVASEDLLKKWLLASGGSCLVLTHHGNPIRPSSNTSQGSPQEPPYPFFPCLVGWAELGTESARGGVGFLPKLPPPHSTPEAGYVAQERHSWAKYNLGWRLSWAGRREEGTLLLPPLLSFLPVPASGCDPWCLAWSRRCFPPSPLPPTRTRLLAPPTQDALLHQGLQVRFLDLGSSPDSHCDILSTLISSSVKWGTMSPCL